MATVFILKVITLLLVLVSKVKLGFFSFFLLLPIGLVIVLHYKKKIKGRAFILILISFTFLFFDSLYINLLPVHKEINSIRGKIKQIRYKGDKVIIHIENNCIKAFTVGKRYSLNKRIEVGDTVRLNGKFKPIKVKDYYFFSENYTHKGFFKKAILIKKNHKTKLFKGSDYSFLLNALILGKRSEIPPRIIEVFRSTSLIHLLAISGMHIGIIIGLIYIIIMFIPIAKRYKLILVSIILIAYALTLGFIPSAVRAIVFSLLIITANIYNKKIRLIDALFGTGFIIIFLRPKTVFSIGFWLSFLATLGIIHFLPLMQIINQKVKNKVLSYTINAVLVSISAQTFIFPIILYNFGQLNLISIFLSFPLSLIITLIIYWAIVSLGFLWVKQISQIFINACDFTVVLLLTILHFANRIEFLKIKLKISFTAFITSYILVFAVSYILSRRIKNMQTKTQQTKLFKIS